MRIIFASKFYYRRGGLEAYLFKTKELLESKGHTVLPFSTDYEKNLPSLSSKYFCKYFDISRIEIKQLNKNIVAFLNMFYNFEAYKKVSLMIREEKPQILQGFGITKHLTASVFKAAKDNGVSTIMRLSDYALLCPNTIALDGDSKVCNNLDCYTKLGIKCLRTKCIRHSFIASLVGFLESKGNKVFDLYRKNVDHWIAPSRFIRDIFIKYFCISEEKISYLPIFIKVESTPDFSKNSGKYFLYSGRLSIDKGIKTLLEAMSYIPEVKLKIAGSGPEENELKEYARKLKVNVEFTGFLAYNEIKSALAHSIALVIPSEGYENSPNTILEAYSMGKPVIGARIGGIPELIVDGETGYTFTPRDAFDLKDKISKLTQDESLVREMGKRGYSLIQDKFNEESHYQKLIKIYQLVLDKSKSIGYKI